MPSSKLVSYRASWPLALAVSVALAACGGSAVEPAAVDEPVVVVDPVVVAPEVRVMVVTSALPLEGVTVEVVGASATATTAADGSATLVLAEAGPVLVKLSKAGYADNFKRAEFAAGASAALVRVDLRARDAGQALDAGTGGRLEGRHGAVIDLPAGALVDAITGVAVSGMIDIAMTPVDVGGDEIRAFPGLFAGIDGAGQRQTIASYGTTEFALSQGGRRLNLAPGQTATIELPIYTPMHSPGVPVAVGDTIPLWSLDEATGLWKQEGSGTVVASTESPTGLAMRATVGHFSWWNCDIGIEKFTVRLCARLPDVADRDRVPVDDPRAVGDINADPNLYRFGMARMVHIDGRTADDRFLRQAGIDFRAAFSDDLCVTPRLQAQSRSTRAGAVFEVAHDLAAPSGRTSSLTACALVQRNGSRFQPEMACGTVFVSGAQGETVGATVDLVIAPAIATDYPRITSDPTGKSVEVGQTATFDVSASRSANPDAPVSYQWTRNGVAIANATSASYTTAPATLADNGGLYAVVVSAPAGTTISLSARLSVTTPPPPAPPADSTTDRWVDAVAGNDANAGTAAAPLRTISAAIAAVRSGGTIWLADGTWTKDVDPDLRTSSTGLNCLINGVTSARFTGTTFRAIHPGMATIRYASQNAICAGDTQVRGLRLEVETMLGDTAAINATGPGSSIVSGTSFSGGFILAAGGARVIVEPAGLANYGDLGDLGGRAIIVAGAGSEVTVAGGRFDRLSAVAPVASGVGCPVGASLYASSGGRLVLQQVDLLAGPPRSASTKYELAVAGCSGARIELAGTTISGFVRDGSVGHGVAVAVANASTVVMSAGTVLTANRVGLAVHEASATLAGGATIAGSLASGIYVSGSSGTLDLQPGSTVSGSASHGIEVATNTAANISVAGATLANNVGSALYAQGAIVCRMRNAQVTGNAFGAQLRSGASCDLGTAASPGGNTFANLGGGVYTSASSAAYTISAVGNTWRANQQGADAAGRYAVAPGKTVLEVTVLNPAGANYRLDNVKSTLRLAE